MKMQVSIMPDGYNTAVVASLDDISYAIGVALRADAPTSGEGCWGRKIAAIKYLREEKGFGLYGAKTLIEFAVKMIEQCEGNKLGAALNPID